MFSFLNKTKAVCKQCQTLQTCLKKDFMKTLRQHGCRNLSTKHVNKITGNSLMSVLSAHFHTTVVLKDQEENISTEDEMLLEDEDYKSVWREYHKIPNAGHRLFVIHPAIKWGRHKPRLTTPDLEMEEACTLVTTLQNWIVVEQRIMKVASQGTRHIFGPTRYEELTDEIRSKRTISAVFLNVTQLSSCQIAEFQGQWKIPVFDRYSIILQIFKEHAKTKVAKLQVALAEIPYIWGRMEEIQTGKADKQIGRAEVIGGSGEKFIHIRKALLRSREAKLRKALVKVKQQRELIRSNRKKRELPTVAVVGYTNSGKTTLIKALTGDEGMIPENHLFATLDVTAHGGLLPNKMTVIYMDTVGFISNLHHKLIDAFSATLEDALIADIVVHVRDISHPDTVNQKENVLKTLKEKLTNEQMENIIEVCNKVDKVPQYIENDEEMAASAVTGLGLQELLDKIQHRMFDEGSSYLQKKLKIPGSGDHLSWLCQEARVQDIQTDSDDNLIVDVIFTKTAYEKFKSKFQNQRIKTEFPKIKRL